MNKKLIFMLFGFVFLFSGCSLFTQPNTNINIDDGVLRNETGHALLQRLDVQYPLPTNGDSIYVKDINVNYSDNGNFSGVITDYFDNLKTVNTDSTNNSIKSIKVWFQRSMQTYSIGFGCDDPNKNFSNIKIKLLGSSETIREVVDKTTDNTKYNSLTLDFEPSKANGVIIEFHTIDEVCLSNLIIWKAENDISQIVAVDEITNEVENVKSRSGSLNVAPTYKDDIVADYYLYRTDATVSITTNTSIDDKSINVNSTVGVVVGDVITIYEYIYMFQSLVTATNATHITFGSPLDFNFTSNALVEIGEWNMAVDGSVTPQIFTIKSPPNQSIHIHGYRSSILDTTDMDDGKFGGITQLTNGVIYRYVNGITKNLCLIVNNLGFYEIGFVTEYSDKAPAGQYGFRARKDIPNLNGVAITLDYSDASEFQVHIQDDLTALDLFATIINGHMVPINQ